MDGTSSLTGQPMGTWLIILLLFLFLLGGNNGFGFGNNNNAAAFMAGAASQDRWPTASELLINNNTMWQNQLMAQQNLANQTNIISTGFCSVNKSIWDSIYEAQKNTCEIIQNANANTQKIIDMMCANTITQLRTDLAEAKLEANNAAQTTELLSKLSPTPIPSYLTYSPYVSVYPPITTTTTSTANW